MKREGIVLIGTDGKIIKDHLVDLQNISRKELLFLDDAENFDEKIISGYDTLLVGLGIEINKELLSKLEGIDYIGVCGTSKKNIDLKEAELKNIEVTNVHGYCDEDTAHYMIMSLLEFYRKKSISVFKKEIGLIGLGAVGKIFGKICLALGMKVSYYTPTRKRTLENELGLNYQDLDRLLVSSEVISLHTPPKTKVISSRHFLKMGNEKLLLNSCLGRPFDEDDFTSWLKKERNFAIFDQIAFRSFDFKIVPKNLSVTELFAYKTDQSSARLSEIVLKNLVSFCEK